MLKRMWEAIAAAIIAIGTVLAAAVKAAIDKRKDTSARAIHDHDAINGVLEELREATDAARCVVVKTHNGGGLPSARTTLKSTALFEKKADRVSSILRRWEGLHVDAEYVRLLSELLEDGEARVDVRSLASEGNLRDIYATAAVQTAHKHYLTHDEKALYYLSVQWDQVDYRPGPNERLAIQAAIPRLRKLLTQ